MKIRAKFTCQSVTKTEFSENVEFHAVYSNTPEDNSYSKATPLAKLSMTIDNPSAQGQFQPGKKYFADFTEAAN